MRVVTEECNVVVNCEGVNCYQRMSDAMYWVLRKTDLYTTGFEST
jgi:hypothetical protein